MSVKLPNFDNAGKITLTLPQRNVILERDQDQRSSSLKNNTFPKVENVIGELTKSISKVKIDSGKYRR